MEFNNVDMDLILPSVKKMVGLDNDYTAFDPEIVMNANAAFQVLFQLGVGEKSFQLDGEDPYKSKWTDLTTDPNVLSFAKTYVPLKVRQLGFDTPTSGSLQTAYDNAIKEMESRISYIVEPEDSILKGE